MRGDLILLAGLVGACTYAFRYLPMRMPLGQIDGRLGRSLAATGPAAVAALVTASMLPMVQVGPLWPLVAGVLTVLAVYLWRRSVVLATLAGPAAYGVALWVLEQGLRFPI